MNRVGRGAVAVGEIAVFAVFARAANLDYAVQRDVFEILKSKHAVVFGAGGSIGSAVAKEFAAEGAEVFLSGRTKSSAEAVANEIVANGGRAHAAAIDTTDDAAVNQYIDSIVKQTGKIDIIFDAAAPLAKEYGNGKVAVNLPIDQFMVPLETMVRSRFITARAAARCAVQTATFEPDAFGNCCNLPSPYSSVSRAFTDYEFVSPSCFHRSPAGGKGNAHVGRAVPAPVIADEVQCAPRLLADTLWLITIRRRGSSDRL